MLVLAYLSQYEFQFGIGALGCVFVVSGLLAALGFGERARMSARTARTTGMLVSLVGFALCGAALADFQPGCNWCRHDGWGGGDSPPLFFDVWLVGLLGIAIFQIVRGLQRGRSASDHSGWSAISQNEALTSSDLGARAELSVLCGVSQTSWGRFSWPLCRAVFLAEGVTFQALGPLRFVAPPFTLRFDQIRSVDRLRAPGLAGVYIYTAVEGFDKILLSVRPGKLRTVEDALHGAATSFP